jgi:hypothetical protein
MPEQAPATGPLLAFSKTLESGLLSPGPVSIALPAPPLSMASNDPADEEIRAEQPEPAMTFAVAWPPARCVAVDAGSKT